jgi:hypothetical protein
MGTGEGANERESKPVNGKQNPANGKQNDAPG